MNIICRQHLTVNCGVVIENQFMMMPILNISGNGLHKRSTLLEIIGVDEI